MNRSEDRLRSALQRPEDDPAGVAVAMNDRGLRDGLLVLAFRGRDWDGLAAAAQLAGRHAADTGEHSVYGPLTVLGIARWMAPGGEHDPEVPRMWAAVPDEDPAHRMAWAAGLVHEQDSDARLRDSWAARMGTLDMGTCLAFRGSAAAPSPQPAPPPAVVQWLSAAADSDPLADAGVPHLRFGPEPGPAR